ncbi:hypothetical protein [Sphingomonas sp.]|uniref:hypothetical protein n=1 Tax=Sphingomonas sp. TaxID=28214 RepID=UPI002DD6577E|nr:hypothetical protein [Sphingomonas sp.]
MALAGHDRGGAIRAELVARIDAMDARADRMATGEIADQLEAIRRIAARNGIGAAITVVHALDSALARGERGPLVHGWLGILRDAVGCGSDSPQAADTFAAACAVRLNG